MSDGQGGTRIQTSGHTPGHIECPVCAGSRMQCHEALTPSLTFKAAFQLWLAHRTIETNGQRTSARFVSERTTKDYKANARILGKFFDALRLEQIHTGHLMAYQEARAVCDQSAGQWTRAAGANCIRKEIGLLIRILRAAGCWSEAEDNNFERVMAVENDVQRAMSPEEQHRFLHLAASREEWQFIYWYAIVALQTTASTFEMRTLRLGDILLRDGVIQIRAAAAKNRFRIRTIPLVTPDVAWALDRLICRAKDLGSSAPSHFLFPFAESKGSYDPTRGMSDSGLKKRWHQVRTAAGVPWLRPYDLRHTAITRLAEAGTPIQVIMSMAGHVTLRMQQHYTAISMMSRRGWVSSAWGESSSAAPQNGPQLMPSVPSQPLPWEQARAASGGSR